MNRYTLLTVRVAFFSLCLAWSTASEAQEPEPATETAPPAAPLDERTNSEQAKERFKRGMQLFDEGDFALALIELERAYELSPNYRALYNIGLVNVQLGHYARASEALRRYLSEGGEAVSAARRSEVTALLEDLRRRTATITIVVHTPGAQVQLDGKGIDQVQLSGPLLVDPGEHTLEAKAAGFVVQAHTLKLASQDAVRLEIKLELARPTDAPKPAPLAPRTVHPPERRVFWPGVAATAALAGGALASGIVSLRADADLRAAKEESTSSAGKREELSQRVNVSAVVTDVLGGLAIVTGGVTLYLSLRRTPAESAPSVILTGNGVSVRGRFQ
jgi:putative ubiquitin-RnfH superfamily antitoxin RatB of RatAB toxin-antitoxin module